MKANLLELLEIQITVFIRIQHTEKNIIIN